MKEQLLIMRPPFSTKHTKITAPLTNIREVTGESTNKYPPYLNYSHGSKRVPVAACFPRDGASRTLSRSVTVRGERLFLPVAARLLHAHLNPSVELLCCE
ncbi:hypothetical protein CDAR_86031 [Caerostris darwini]|uniref:Uncharacterized protein n=1 Tax=Caerostris darwini TaxID=1538125 RepID=A0AAV4V3N7_9ARAC|nr:hypothetical protein CDAR_86031 [Caerostris darwini]